MNVEKLEQFKNDELWTEFKGELDKVIDMYKASLLTCSSLEELKGLQVKIWTVEMLKSYPQTLIDKQAIQSK